MNDTRKRVARLKFRHLSVIHAVGREGSLQRASEQLALTQSAISKTLAEAEAIMQAQLFERTPLGSRATALGDVLVRYGAKVMAEIDRAGEEFGALEDGESGTLTVGIFTPIGWWGQLARGVNDFQSVAPRIRLTLRQGAMEKMMESLERGDIDLLVGRTTNFGTTPGVVAYPLHDDGGPKFVASADHPLVQSILPITLSDVVRYPWFVPEGPNILLETLQIHVRTAGLPWPSRVIYSHVYTINLAVCSKSEMIALLPGFTLPEVSMAYGLTQLEYDPPYVGGSVSAFCLESRALEPGIRKFVDCVANADVRETRQDAGAGTMVADKKA